MSDYKPIKIQKKIRMICADRDITQIQLAEMHGAVYGTFKNKLSRNKMSFAEVEKIMDELDCDIVFVDRKTKKVY